MNIRTILKSSLLLTVLYGGIGAQGGDFDKIKVLISGGDTGPSKAGQASATSSVRVYPKLGIVVKHVTSYLEYGVFQREVNALLRLRDFSHVPKLLYVDYENNSFYMEYGGNKMDKTNVPEDWKTQVREIIDGLKERGIYHNDIKDAEMLVNDKGTIMLIDYGWASPLPTNQAIGSPLPQKSYNLPDSLRAGIGGSFKAPGARDDRFSIVKAVQVAKGLPSDSRTVKDLVAEIFTTTARTPSSYKIIRAQYGSKTKSINVMAKLTAALRKDPKVLDGQPGTLNSLFGDPAPGVEKSLVIVYLLNGDKNEQTKSLGEEERFSF